MEKKGEENGKRGKKIVKKLREKGENLLKEGGKEKNS